MYEEHIFFMEWAKNYDIGNENMRSKVMHDSWTKLFLCEKAIVDGTKSVEDNLKLISQYLLF